MSENRDAIRQICTDIAKRVDRVYMAEQGRKGEPAAKTAPADKSAPLAASAPSRVPATPAPVAQPARSAGSPPAGATSKAPPLDLSSLEQQLKDTKAFGVLTKLTVGALTALFFIVGIFPQPILNMLREYPAGTAVVNPHVAEAAHQ